MINTHDASREKRIKMLNGYITYCAIMIQRNWRGKMARKYQVPFLTKLGGRKAASRKIKAIVDGWRTRSIMKLAEVVKRKQSIKDHD